MTDVACGLLVESVAAGVEVLSRAFGEKDDTDATVADWSAGAGFALVPLAQPAASKQHATIAIAATAEDLILIVQPLDAVPTASRQVQRRFGCTDCEYASSRLTVDGGGEFKSMPFGDDGCLFRLGRTWAPHR